MKRIENDYEYNPVFLMDHELEEFIEEGAHDGPGGGVLDGSA